MCIFYATSLTNTPEKYSRDSSPPHPPLSFSLSLPNSLTHVLLPDIGIIVIGATNFAESLDTALLRPGRFDKHVAVPLPDVGGRKEILEMYAAKTKIADNVDLNILARGTTGFSGADLYNLMNQAAVKASVDGLDAITMQVFEWAKDKILMGAERKSAVITPETAKCTAYHEAGHALVGVLTEGARTIHKATIMPRGQSLGMVTMLPEGDQTSMSYRQMLAELDVCMGGRIAEELIFGTENVTSGASSDIQQATNIARSMVTKYGFSDNVGIVYYGGSTGQQDASSKMRDQIDDEVKRLTSAAYERARVSSAQDVAVVSLSLSFSHCLLIIFEHRLDRRFSKNTPKSTSYWLRHY